MADNLTRLSSIAGKISKMIGSYESLEEKNRQLMEERALLQKQLSESSERNKVLENKLQFLKMSKGMSLTNEENKDVRDKIDNFIKEIDKCISKLNA